MCFFFVSGRRKIHYTLNKGLEMAEEYDMRTGDLVGIFDILICIVTAYVQSFNWSASFNLNW